MDICLPYRHSAIFAQTESYDNRICKRLSSWDSYSRNLVYRASQGLTSFSSKVEQDAVNPNKLSPGDFLLFWRVVQVLPLVAVEVPASSGAVAKLIALCIGLALFLAVICRFIEEIWLVVAGISHTASTEIDPDDEIFKALLSRNTSPESRKLRW